MDIIKIFTVLEGFFKIMLATALIINKSFMRTFPLYINNFTNRFGWLTITNKIVNKFTNGITNDPMTSITETDRLVTSNVSASWLILLTLRTLPWVTLLERAVDGLTSWLTLLTLQTLPPVTLLEETVLPTFNGLTSWLTLLTLQTLCLVAFLEQKSLLTFNDLTSSLTLLV